MNEVPAQDVAVVLDHLAAQADLLAGEFILVGVHVGDVLAGLEFGDRDVLGSCRGGAGTRCLGNGLRARNGR